MSGFILKRLYLYNNMCEKYNFHENIHNFTLNDNCFKKINTILAQNCFYFFMFALTATSVISRVTAEFKKRLNHS